MIQRGVVAGAVWMLMSGAAMASPVTLTSQFTQEAEFEEWIWCADSTTLGSLSDTCSGSIATGNLPQTGYFEGTVEATASTLGSLTLGAYATLDAWRINSTYQGDWPPYIVAATATATIDDTITILGAGDIASGYLRLTFDLDGSVAESVDISTLDGFDPDIPGAQFFADGYAFLTVNGVPGGVVRSNTTVTLDVPFTFGSPESLTLMFLARASAEILVSEGYRVTTDFLNTATLSGSTILDGGRTAIPGAYLQSTNGFSYGELAPQPVPEPSTIALVGLGLAAAGRRLTRRRRTP